MTAHPARLPRSKTEQALLEDGLREIFQSRITFNRVLGLHILSFDPRKPAMGFSMTPALVGHYHYGRLHGGVISAALDTTAGSALMCAIGEHFKDESSSQVLGRFQRMGTIDLRIDFLRQGVGASFIATATITRLGGRVASTQMALHNDQGLLIATGAGAYVVS
jgi:uncharacterized protein (TIGR00369 family)